MPVFNAHIPADHYSRDQKRALADALNLSLTEALGIPVEDRFVMISEHGDSELFLHPDYMGMRRGPDAMIITVLFGAHRPLRDKRAVTAVINKLVVDALGISPDDIFVALIPVPSENFSFGRGELQLAPPEPRSNEEIAAVLKARFTGYEHDDNSPLVALLSKDFTFEMSDSLPYGGTYIGPGEFAAWWEAVGAQWEHFRYEAHEVIVSGDTFVIPVRTDALSKEGIRMRNEHLFLFKAKDGKLVHGRLYADTARGRDVIEGREPQRYPRPEPR